MLPSPLQSLRPSEFTNPAPQDPLCSGVFRLQAPFATLLITRKRLAADPSNEKYLAKITIVGTTVCIPFCSGCAMGRSVNSKTGNRSCMNPMM